MSDELGPAATAASANVLTIVVPCYNSAAYLHRCVESLLTDAHDVEVILVDDGSKDATVTLVDAYAEKYPHLIRAVHQPNGGHGAAVNTGVANATGRYVKVVDSDDWLDTEAYASLLSTLRGFGAEGPDAVVSNFVYEKEDRRRRTAMRYSGVLPEDVVFGWDQVGKFRTSQYILMHSLVYRTAMLHECGLKLPEHTFYVDNIYAYVPLVHVRTLYYLNVDLYRYYIGRPDQSVNEQVMISRLDQQIKVNRLMVEHLLQVWNDPQMPPALHRYLVHYARIVTMVSSILLLRAGTDQALKRKQQLWDDLRGLDADLHRALRRSLTGRFVNLPGRPGRKVSVLLYLMAQRVIGFN